MTTIPPVDTTYWVVSATGLYGTVEAADETEAKSLGQQMLDGNQVPHHTEVHVRPLARGTNPSPTEPHEARIVKDPREHMTGMVSEIEDGTLVAWDTCGACHKHVFMGCKCSDGPTEPKYIGEWREKRFARSIKTRLDPPKPDYREPVLRAPVRPDIRPEPQPEEAEVAASVNDGLDKALTAVTAAKEDQ